MRTPSVRILVLLAGCAAGVGFIVNGAAVSGQAPAAASATVAPLKGETHLSNIRQLTFGGENAEAYFSFDGTRLSFQAAKTPATPATRSTR